MIGKAEYSEDDRNLVLMIDEDIYARLKETQNAHTEFNTLDVMKLEKIHSIRMLMLSTYICGFTTTKQKQYTLQQLNFMFDTKYKEYIHFTNKILDNAKKELEDNGLISFDYVKAIDKTYMGKGRKPISHITITPIVPKYTDMHL